MDEFTNAALRSSVRLYGVWCFLTLLDILSPGESAKPDKDAPLRLELKETAIREAVTLSYTPEGEGFSLSVTAGEGRSAEFTGEKSFFLSTGDEEISFAPNDTGAMRRRLDRLLYPPFSAPDGLLELMLRELDERQEKTLLIGAVRGEHQLEVSLRNGFYHIPADIPGTETLEITHVAICQSRRQFGEAAGVRWYGAVKSVKKVKRSEIAALPRRSDREYWYIEVEKWKALPRPVTVDDGGGFVCRFSDMFSLKNSRFISQMFAQDKEEFLLYERLGAYAGGPLVNRDGVVSRFRYKNRVITLGYGEIFICGSEIKRYRAADFLASPRAVVEEAGKE